MTSRGSFIKCAGRRAFPAFIALFLSTVTPLLPSARADTPTGLQLSDITETSLGFSWVLDNPAEEYSLVVLSTVADFSVTLSSATSELGLQTTIYYNLDPNTSFYFKVKVSTEPDDNYTAVFDTATYIEAPVGLYFEAVSSYSITAAAYAPLFTKLEEEESGVNISIGGSYTRPWRNGNKWTAKTVLPVTARSGLSAGVINGRLYAVGGNIGSVTDLNRAYNSMLNTWESKTGMTTAREDLAVGVVGGKLYAVGGYNAGYLDTNEEYDPVSGNWTAKAAMTTARRGLAAGVMGGKLYAVGGYNGNSLNTNEEYDPVANSWTAKTGMPATLRYNLAVGVIEGRLYAVGGYDFSALSTNQEYNPESDGWTTKASMPAAREKLAAAVIGGKLYAVGGGASGALATNYAYDPVEDGWQTMAPMPTAREGLAAGAIDGKLYAVGGKDGADLDTNEEYDPGVAHTFVGLVPNTQYIFQGKARNRRAVETGFTGELSTYTLAAVPGAAAAAFTAVSSYAVTVAWTRNGNPDGITLYRAQVSADAGFVAVAGSSDTYGLSAVLSGFAPNTTYYARVTAINNDGLLSDYSALGSTMTRMETPSGVYFDEVSSRAITASAYGPVFTDITTGLSGVALDKDGEGYSAWRTGDTWTSKTAMTTARMDFAAVAAGGKIYAIGGVGGSGFCNQNEEYDPVSNAWTARAVMPTARDKLAAAAVGGKIYAIGGSTGTAVAINEQYDPESNTWTAKTGMSNVRYWLSAAAGANGRIYAMGGNSNGDKNEEYDPAADAWTPKTNMLANRYKAAAAAVGDKIYLIGGTVGAGALTKNEEYDTISNAWTTKASMPTARYSLAAAVLGGNIYALGGGPGPSSANEEYNPFADNWEVKSDMSLARESLAAAPVRGRVYAIGGWAVSEFRTENEAYDPGVAVSYTGLIPNTQYAFKAKARNYAGTETAESPEISTYTLAAVPGAPSVTVLSSTTQGIVWSDNGNPFLTGYILKYSTSPDFPAAVSTELPLFLTVTAVLSLTPNTSYYYDVRAFNETGVLTDFTGHSASSCTFAALPGNPSITGRTATSQDVAWDNGGNPDPGTDYLLKYSTSAAFTPSVTTTTLVSAAEKTVTGLVSGTSYYYDVAAINHSGISSGYTGYPVAGYTLPSAPGDPVPEVMGASSITWTWAAATGAESYNIYAASEPATVIGTSLSNDFIEMALTPNTSYGILVSAVDPAGESAKSSTVSTYTFAAVPVDLSTGPAAPAFVFMDISWGANDNPAGTVYSLAYWQDGGSTSTFETVLVSTTIEDLTESTSYYFTVRARNEAGFYSPAAGPFLMPTLALPPAVVTAEPQGPVSIRWSWTAVPTAQGYNIYPSSSPESPMAFSYANMFLETGLSTNSLYGIQVAVVNLAGEGVGSLALTTFTYAAVPGEPAITAAEAASQLLYWDDQGNSVGTDYVLKYSTSSNFDAAVTTTVNTNTVTVEPLSPNTSYYYDVAAINAAGIPTAYTGVPVSSYTMAAVPGPPVIYGYADVSQSVYWEDNENPVVETSYRVMYSTSPGFEAEVTTAAVVPSTYTTIPNLTPNTSYYFDAAAINKIGVQSEFTGQPAAGYTLAAIPGNPSIIGWTTTTHHLEWASGGNPDPGTDYRVEYSTSGDFTPSVSSAVVAASTSTTVSGLVPGTSYYYRVAAVNRSGGFSGFAGQTVSGYTLAAPPETVQAEVLGVSSISWTWSVSTSALNYQLYSTDDPLTPIATQAGPPFIQVGLSTNSYSGLLIAAVNLSGEGTQSEAVISCTLASIPGPPSVVGQTDTAQYITWDENENPLSEMLYLVRYSTSPDFYSVVTSSFVTVSTWAVISGLNAGVLYYSDVAAVNKHSVETVFTGFPSSGYTLPPPPSAPAPYVLGVSSISWSWAATQSATGYKVYTADALPVFLDSVTDPVFVYTGLSSNTLSGVAIAAVNPAGEGALSSAVSTYTLSAVPGAPALDGRNAFSQNLVWSENGNALPGTDYTVRYSTSPDFTPLYAAPKTVSSTFTTIIGLMPNTSYFYDVAALNTSGVPSAYTGLPVAGYTLADVPGTPFIVGQSANSQTLIWNPAGNPVPGTDYLLKYSTSVEFTPSVTTMTVVDSTFTTVSGLESNTSYYYNVAAITVDSELSDFTSSPAAGYTLAAVPGAPAITARSSTTQSVEWDAAGNPDPGTTYRLRYSTSPGFTSSVTTYTVLGSTFVTVTGLTAGTSYYYDAAAYNDIAVLSAYTGTPAAGYTLPDTAPTPSGTGTGATAILWTWAPVESAVSYNIYAPTTAPALVGTSDSESFSGTGLSTNTLNGVFIAAVNPAGEGELSGPATAYTLSAVPVALSTGPDAATGASITVQWSSNTNLPGTYYEVDYWTAGGATTTVSTTLTSGTVSGLSESTSWYFQVRARNDAGQLSAPAELFFPTMPGSPAGLTATALGVGSIRWDWDPVATVSMYRLYLATETGTLIAESASPYYLATGFSTNTLHGVVVSAVNLAGASTQSAEFSTYTLAAQPVALSTGPDAATNNSVTLQWEANTNLAGTRYRIDYWTGENSTVTATTELTSATLSGLAEAASYYFWVRALNEADIPTGPAVILAPTLSGGPVGLYGTTLGIGSINWLWGPVPTASAYYVYPSTEPETLIFSTNTESFVQTGLTPNAVSSVLVAALNAAGLSPKSSPDSPIYTYAMPPADEAVDNVYITSAAISWTLNGNPAGTEAEVERSTDNFNYGNVMRGPHTDFTDSGLEACTSYYFRIRNMNGSSVATIFSSTLTLFTTGQAPLPPGSLSAEALAGNSILLTWEPSPSGIVSFYNLYYDNGSGTIDYDTPLKVLTSTVTAYTKTGLSSIPYKFGLRAAFCGNEEQNLTVVAAASASNVLPGVRAALRVPPAGKKIYGNRVTLVAGLDSGTESQVSGVKFQYKSAAAGTWSDVVAANAEHPNPDTAAPYLVHWDVSSFTAGSYNLRAIAKDQQNQADPDPPYISVQVSSSAPDINENLVGGAIQKEQKVYSAVSNAVQATDTRLVIPAGAISDSTATVTVTNKPSNVPAAPAIAQGCGVAAEITLSNGQTLLAAGKTAAVTLAFTDNDNNGYLDEYPNVRTSNLQIYSYLALNGWRKDFSSTVDLSAKTVTGNTPHFSFFALFAPLGSDLASIEVYPVPFIPNDGDANTGVSYAAGNNNSGIIFDVLPASVSIKIYTITGQLVAELGSQSSGGMLQWDVKNDSGVDAATGGYIAVISSPGHDPVVKKLLVIR